MNSPDPDRLRTEIVEAERAIIRLEKKLVEERMMAKRRERTFRYIQLLYQELSHAQDVQTVYQATVRSLAEKVGFDRTIVFKQIDQQFVPVAFWGYSSDVCVEKLKNPFFINRIQQNQIVLVNSTTRHTCPPNYEVDLQVQYFVAIPFSVQGNIPHILFAGNQSDDTLRRPHLTEMDVETLHILANQIANVINQIELYHQAQTSAQEARIHADKLQRSLQELQRMQLQLIQSEKMSALGSLVSGVAHEINNPVSFVQGNLDLVQEQVTDLIEHLAFYQRAYPNPAAAIVTHAKIIHLDYLIEDLPQMLAAMGVGAERIQQISLSLRTFARADRTEKLLFDVHEGLDSTLLLLRHRLKANNQRPEIQIIKQYGSLPEINCYPGQLGQVFMNLLVNAIDAFDESNQGRCYEEIEVNPNLITLTTWLERSPTPSVVIQIADNGMGMTESVRHRIFDHLFTTKSIGRGTGLGLSISRQIVVENHGGRLECQSAPGQGATFLITLPLHP